jgi:hypothetical protein
MATEKKYLCPKCHEPQWPSLFEALFDKAHDGLRCPKPECSGEELEMELNFDWGLRGKVIDAFLPDDITEWDGGEGEGQEHWEFYPFFVVIESLERDDPGRQVWQPYWHKVTLLKDNSVRTPYGQWAACLDIDAYQQLLRKAKAKGYLQD